MNKNTHVPLMRLIIAVLAVVVVLQQYQIRILSEDADANAGSRQEGNRKPRATVPAPGAPKATALPQAQSRAAALAERTGQGPAQSVKAPPALPPVVQPSPAADANAEPAPTAAESPMAKMAEMMRNPAMKEMMRANARKQLDMSYGALLKTLSLAPKDLEAFKALLVEKQMSLMDFGMDMIDTGITPESRQEQMAKMKEVADGFDSDIKKVLGEDNYVAYKSFEETQPERMQVDLFKQSLEEGNALDEHTENDLIKAMHEERKSFQFSTSLGQPETADPTAFTEEKIAAHLKDMARLQENYLLRARSILTPAQFEQFKKSQDQQRAMQEMGMKMAAQMLNKPKQPAAAPAGKSE